VRAEGPAAFGRLQRLQPQRRSRPRERLQRRGAEVYGRGPPPARRAGSADRHHLHSRPRAPHPRDLAQHRARGSAFHGGGAKPPRRRTRCSSRRRPRGEPLPDAVRGIGRGRGAGRPPAHRPRRPLRPHAGPVRRRRPAPEGRRAQRGADRGAAAGPGDAASVFRASAGCRAGRLAPALTLSERGGIMTETPVTLFSHSHFSGDFVPLEEGYTRFLSEFNDAASSVRVAPGYCAVLYEHANEFGGYGASLDLLEDCPDLSVYGFDRKTSYVNVFRAEQNGFVWARGSMRNGEFVHG